MKGGMVANITAAERFKRMQTAEGRMAEWSELSESGNACSDERIDASIGLALYLAVSLGNPTEIARVAKVASDRKREIASAFDVDKSQAFVDKVLTAVSLHTSPSTYAAILAELGESDEA